MKYGRFEVTHETNTRRRSRLSDTTWYYVETNGEPSVKVGSGSDGKKLARTLAATLNAANVHDFDVLPPGLDGDEPMHPDDYSDNEWESWASDNEVVPVRIARGGKAAIAGYLKVVHRERENWIASRLGVSESTVRQYLSDLREGRR
jgi:hypothetical protein